MSDGPPGAHGCRPGGHDWTRDPPASAGTATGATVARRMPGSVEVGRWVPSCTRRRSGRTDAHRVSRHRRRWGPWSGLAPGCQAGTVVTVSSARGHASGSRAPTSRSAADRRATSTTTSRGCSAGRWWPRQRVRHVSGDQARQLLRFDYAAGTGPQARVAATRTSATPSSASRVGGVCCRRSIGCPRQHRSGPLARRLESRVAERPATKDRMATTLAGGAGGGSAGPGRRGPRRRRGGRRPGRPRSAATSSRTGCPSTRPPGRGAGRSADRC